MSTEKKDFLLNAIKDHDDFYAKNQTKILASIKGAAKLLSEKDRVNLYAKLFEKEGLKKTFFDDDLSVLHKAYLKCLKHLPARHSLLFLFVFGFDKKDELPTGKTVNQEGLKEYFLLVERYIGKKDIKDIMKRKTYFLEIAKQSFVSLRVMDCFRLLGYLDVPGAKSPKGAIDFSLFVALFYLAALNKKTRMMLEKNIKSGTFHVPGDAEIQNSLLSVYKDLDFPLPQPPDSATN